MKIVNKRAIDTVPFGTIRVGEVFTDNEGDFMMRIEDIEVEDNGIYNAINLETGDAYTFAVDQEVNPLPNAYIVIN